MARHHPHVRAILAYMRLCGVTDARAETSGSNHVVIVFTRGAARCRLSTANTPENAGDQLNYARQALRRMFGVAPPGKK